MGGHPAVRGISRGFLAKRKNSCTHQHLPYLRCLLEMQSIIITVYFRRGATPKLPQWFLLRYRPEQGLKYGAIDEGWGIEAGGDVGKPCTP